MNDPISDKITPDTTVHEVMKILGVNEPWLIIPGLRKIVDPEDQYEVVWDFESDKLIITGEK